MLTLDRHHLDKPRSYLLIHSILELSLLLSRFTNYPPSVSNPNFDNCPNSSMPHAHLQIGQSCFFFRDSVKPSDPPHHLHPSDLGLAVTNILVDHGNQVSGRLARLFYAGLLHTHPINMDTRHPGRGFLPIV